MIEISSMNIEKGVFSSTLKIMAEGFAGDIDVINKKESRKDIVIHSGKDGVRRQPIQTMADLIPPHIRWAVISAADVRIYPKLPDSKNKEFYQKQNLIK